MKSKFILILSIIVLLICVGFVFFLKKDSRQELTYINEIIGASSETKYLSETITNVLSYLNDHNIEEKTDFNKMNINSKKFSKCMGIITPQKSSYLVEANCGNDKNDGYNINVHVSSSELNLKTVDDIIPIENGNLYFGVSKEEKRLSLGFLDSNMNILWEYKIPIKNENAYIQKVDTLSDGYLVSIINFKDEDYKDIDYYELVKIDKSGQILKQVRNPEYKSLNNSSNDIVLMKSTDSVVVLLDKNLKKINELELVKPYTLKLEKDNIYYIDEDKMFHITNIKGKQKSSFELDTDDEYYSQIEIVGNKILVAGDKNIVTYDKNGNMLKKFNYSNLRPDKKIYKGEHFDTSISSVIRVGEFIYVNVLFDVYHLLDYYDSNLEKVHRNIFEIPFVDIGSSIYKQKIVVDENPYNLNYSDEYSRFVKIEYTPTKNR